MIALAVVLLAAMALIGLLSVVAGRLAQRLVGDPTPAAAPAVREPIL